MKTYTFIFFIFFSSILQNLNAQKDLSWSANDHFILAETPTVTKINMNKMAWEAFTLVITEQDLSEYPFISFKIKSDFNIDLRVDLLDKTHVNLTKDPIIEKVFQGDDFVELKYNFERMKGLVDLKKISHFQFFVNPGRKHAGTVSIKDVIIGKPVESDVEKPSITFFPNPIIDQLTINSKIQQFDEIQIIDALGKIVFSTKIGPTNQETFHLGKLPQGLFSFELKHNGKKIYTNSFVQQIF